MSETVRSSVFSVTRTPARMQAEQRVVLEGRHDLRLDVRGGAQVEPGPAADELGDEVRVVDGEGPVGDALRVDRERPAHLRRAAPLAGVGGDVEPDPRARSIASWWIVGSGKRCSGPARSTPTRPSGIPFASRSRTKARLASGSCERISVAISRASMPAACAASRAPFAVASTTCLPVSPLAVWSRGAQRTST